MRNPWTVLCAVAAVVLGPAATRATALAQANKAPLHQAANPGRAPHPHLPGAGQAQAYLPSEALRRRDGGPPARAEATVGE
ncbi:hypothetical protein C3488_27420 [Streptomyces sp. Ru72]|nr:hypothetical protein C3488_27420 [Streptomyces sp. Ru72]